MHPPAPAPERRPRPVRRLIRWMWEVDHDDTVPTVLAGLVPPLALLAALLVYADPLEILIGVFALGVLAVTLWAGRGIDRAHRTVRRVQCESPNPLDAGPRAQERVPS